METFKAIKKTESKQNATNSFFSGIKNSMPFIQPKLTINQPNDVYEQEADAMADKVMLMEQPGVQLKPLPISSVQRKCEHCEEEEKKMQRKEMNGEEKTAGNNLESYVGALSGGGQSLPNEVRSFYEPRFGYDFGNVKLHTDTVAAKSAQSINALAYTSGNNIVFNNGQYSPNTDSGKKLLGHELTHVVQQRAGVSSDFKTSLVPEGSNSFKEKPFASTLKFSSLIQTNKSSSIQRTANFVPGTVNATTNLAAHLISGNTDAGFTPPTLNGATIMSVAAAQAAIRRPVIVGNSVRGGTVEVWVASVPVNEGSFTMQLPSAGPWKTRTTKANVDALFASFSLPAQAGCTRAGRSRFSVHGQPTDAGFAANTRTHENLHAADHQAGFNSIMVPWDARLQAAQNMRRRFSGTTIASAEAALFNAMRGTPDDIAAAQFSEWIRLNNITHRGTTLATGGPAIVSNSAANAKCSTSSVDVT